MALMSCSSDLLLDIKSKITHPIIVKIPSKIPAMAEYILINITPIPSGNVPASPISTATASATKTTDIRPAKKPHINACGIFPSDLANL